MSMWTDAKKPAMRMEEAALLPALGRGMAGRAALQAALAESRKLDGKKAAKPSEEKREIPLGADEKKPGRSLGRAALGQVWKGHWGNGR